MNTIEFLASDGGNVLWDRLSRLFGGASVLRIASAFLGAPREIVSWVEQDPKRRVEIIVRFEYPTNPDSVAALLKHPQVAIRAASGAQMPFHEKLFLAVDSAGEAIGAYVGSANWTQGGLRRNREAGVWVTEHEILRQIANHFAAGYQVALQISDQMLAELRTDFLRQESHRKTPGKDRGTLIASWRDLRAAGDGQFLIKQGGISARPFREGKDEFCELVRPYSSQTFSRIPSTFKPGLGVIICRIANRGNGSRDRLICGRGRIAGFDRKRWRLPEKYVAALRRRGVDPKTIEHLKRWPEILWLDPAEYINYPPGCNDFLWLGEYMPPSFREGFRWIPANIWEACNQSLDQHTEKFGVLPPDRQGIWWNQHVGIMDPSDRLFITKARIEEMNLGR